MFRRRTYSDGATVPATAANGAGTPFRVCLFVIGAGGIVTAIFVWGLPAFVISGGLMLLYISNEVGK